MIRPISSDLKRRVVWTNRITKRQRRGTLERFDESFAWVLYEDDPEPRPRATIRCILDWADEAVSCD